LGVDGRGWGRPAILLLTAVSVCHSWLPLSGLARRSLCSCVLVLSLSTSVSAPTPHEHCSSSNPGGSGTLLAGNRPDATHLAHGGSHALRDGWGAADERRSRISGRGVFLEVVGQSKRRRRRQVSENGFTSPINPPSALVAGAMERRSMARAASRAVDRLVITSGERHGSGVSLARTA
jgi:hypothetical protein